MSLNLNDVNDSVSEDDLKQRGIYVIINTCTNKVYAGKTEKSFKYRYDVHYYCLCHNVHYNKHLQNSFNKYGSDAFIFCIYKIAPFGLGLQDVKDYRNLKKWLNENEIDTIKTLRTLLGSCNVYNQNDGGEGGINPTEELSSILSKRNVESWKNESIREKRIAGIRKTCKKNSESGKLSKVQQKSWKNDKTRENRINGLYKAYQDPIKKQRHLEGVRNFYKSFEGKWQLALLRIKRHPESYAKFEKEHNEAMKKICENKELLSIVLR